MIPSAFEGFAQSLRIQLEQHFSAQNLLTVDPHEASGNIERSTTDALNSFHNLYDSILQSPEVDFDCWAHPETATILSIRNARHHNNANQIRGLYTYHLQQDAPEQFSEYAYINCPETNDGGTTFDSPISWFDLQTLLEMPTGESRIRNSARAAIKNDLSFEKLSAAHQEVSVNPERVFINLTPLIVNACKRLLPEIKDRLAPRSTEAKHFAGMFEHVEYADTENYETATMRVGFPWLD